VSLPVPDGAHDDLEGDEQLVLVDLLNHVLDKGVVIHGSVVLSIANIDLVSVDLRLVIASVEALVRRAERSGESP
jgi:hypothetical protein